MTSSAELAAPPPDAPPPVTDPGAAHAVAAAALSEPQSRWGAPPDPPATPAEAAPSPPGAPPPAASHDTPPPPALLDFMLQGWQPPTGDLPDAIEHAAAFHARRRALSAQYPGETLVVAAGHLKVRSNDTHYRFRPSSEFYYLTGNQEPDCLLVLEPDASGGHRDILFVEPNPGQSDATFFTDRVKGALWVGPRLGVPETRARYGVDECRPLSALKEYLEGVAGGARPSRAVRGTSAVVDSALSGRAPWRGPSPPPIATRSSASSSPRCACSRTRWRSPSCAPSSSPPARASRTSSSACPRPAASARWRASSASAPASRATTSATAPSPRPAPTPACSTTPTTAVPSPRGSCSSSTPASRATRSTPPTSRARCPSPAASPAPQRTIYKLVHKAQKAAFAQVKPGNDFMDPNKAAMRVLAEGLSKLGILETTAEHALEEEHQFYKRYSLHNVSHMLGLDVHDCAEARKEAYKLGKLRAGMVLTVEPGLYFQTDDLTVPEEYRGIGVRIEDDLVVTEDGYENLSADIPSQIDDVEAWMERLWRKKRG